MPLPNSVRVLTPPGRGAVAVVELQCDSNEAAIQILDRAFRSASGAALSTASLGRILYGRWSGEDVVLVRTAVATWEVHCHGGIAAVQSILRVLADPAPGATALSLSTPALAAAAATTPATVLAESGATLESEVRRLLLLARTRRTAVHILAQTSGRLRESLDVILSGVVEHQLPKGTLASAKLDELLRWTDFADHLIVPRRVLVLGRPNVGKSSLMNRIVGFDRSIVFDQPGTTRDLVEAPAVLQGWPFLFCDSAGIRDATESEIEQAGVQSAIAAVRECDAVVLVWDASRPGEESSWWPQDILHSGKPLLLVANKVDLCLPENDSASSTRIEPSLPGFASLHGCKMLETSAATGFGVSQLIAEIVALLVAEEPAVGTPLPLPGALSSALRELRDSDVGSGTFRAAVRRLQDF